MAFSDAVLSAALRTTVSHLSPLALSSCLVIHVKSPTSMCAASWQLSKNRSQEKMKAFLRSLRSGGLNSFFLKFKNNSL